MLANHKFIGAVYERLIISIPHKRRMQCRRLWALRSAHLAINDNYLNVHQDIAESFVNPGRRGREPGALAKQPQRGRACSREIVSPEWVVTRLAEAF
jgi:hypothetical protein